ncbi:acetylglutamate kinase [Tyzzerella sp. An114]|uniref:acetylglutamate kinase n=1 Tax=Tyzzerella sp. An114 TaxID=1965545 RepID=UPI001FA9112A|nr:acetylglutamate kinase [Tyzzerella sp. An114]
MINENSTMKVFIEKAEVLIEALPYIQKFYGKTVVIKYGGSALINPEIKETIIKDIALMKLVGMKPVIVHGGGPDINAFLKKMDIKSEFINGLRVTDPETMQIVEMVLAGKLNKSIVTDIELQGVKSVGISGKDGGILKAEKIEKDGIDYGCVGDVKEVDTSLIESLINNDFVPVIAPIGKDDAGTTYNINADYAAVAIAGALKAEKLVFLTDVEGVMRDVHDPDSIMSFIRADKVQALIDDGTISGGMIPKVQCCMAGVEAGVENVHILDGRVEHCLLLEIFTQKGIGTMISK